MFNMSAYAEWESGIENRNRHVLKQLLGSERVGKILAVDYLPHTFKRALRVYREDRLAKPAGEVVFKSFFSRAVKISKKLTVYSSVWPKISAKKFYDELGRLLVKLKFGQFIIWSYYPLTVDYFWRLNRLGQKPVLKVFDAVDNWSEHPAYLKFKKKLLNNYQRIDAEADVIFAVNGELKNLFSHQEKFFLVPNGADLAHYQKEYTIINRDIGEIKPPIIGYVGTIQERFDADLLSFLAQNNQEKSFVLVGPVWQKAIREKLAGLANVYFLGRKSYDEVPMYLKQFAACIIPHQIDAFTKSNDPMKIYEYLACGKAVVSTQGTDLEDLKPFVYSSGDWQQFNQHLNDALKEDSDLLREQRLAAIQNHSWQKRVERMWEVIEQKLNKIPNPNI